MIVSSKILVWGAVEVAQSLGVSDLVIGLTIVAIGTSLPELAASVASALKGHHDMAIGAIIGSNTFNLLAVMPIPGLFYVTQFEEMVLIRDIGAMVGITLLFVGMLLIKTQQDSRLGRGKGLLQFFSYVLYMGTLFVMAPPV